MRKQALDKTDIAIIGHLQVDGRRAWFSSSGSLVRKTRFRAGRGPGARERCPAEPLRDPPGPRDRKGEPRGSSS